jgi:hypothetical protein
MDRVMVRAFLYGNRSKRNRHHAKSLAKGSLEEADSKFKNLVKFASRFMIVVQMDADTLFLAPPFAKAMGGKQPKQHVSL